MVNDSSLPDEVVDKLICYKNYDTTARVLLNVWADYDLDEALNSYFVDRGQKIDFIIHHGLIDSNEMITYLNFKDYPDHKEALIDAGLITGD